MSVEVPWVVPYTTTETPGIGSLLSSVTVPFTDMVCAKAALKQQPNTNQMTVKNFTFISLVLLK